MGNVFSHLVDRLPTSTGTCPADSTHPGGRIPTALAEFECDERLMHRFFSRAVSEATLGELSLDTCLVVPACKVMGSADISVGERVSSAICLKCECNALVVQLDYFVFGVALS